MKNIKYFENYNENKCVANLLILHRKTGEYRLLIELTSSSGFEFHPDGTTISESDAKKLINEFGAKVEER
jgi:hypothetical protein